MSWEAFGDPPDPIELPEGCWDEDAALEAQACIDMAAKFYDEIMPQIGQLCIKDYNNMNDLGILLSSLKTKEKEIS